MKLRYSDMSSGELSEFFARIIRTCKWLRVLGFPIEHRGSIGKYWYIPYTTYHLVWWGSWTQGSTDMLIAGDFSKSDFRRTVRWEFLSDSSVRITACPEDLSFIVKVLDLFDMFRSRRLMEIEGYELLESGGKLNAV